MHSFFTQKNKLFLFVFCTICFVLPGYVMASDIIIDSLPGEKDTVINVLLDSYQKNINAVSGTIAINSPGVHVTDIITKDSLVTFWVDKPTINPDRTEVSFSGIIPGGVTVKGVNILSILVNSSTIKSSGITISNTRVLLNDGLGTDDKVFVRNSNNEFQKKYTDVRDTIKPEKFTLLRAKDPSIFNGNWFVSFYSQDKGSGLDYYTVCELFSCHRGDSPYEFKKQSSWYIVSVTAHDYDGNTRISFLISHNIKILYTIIFSCGILCLLYVLFLRYKKNIF